MKVETNYWQPIKWGIKVKFFRTIIIVFCSRDAIKTRILDDENDYFQTNSQWLNDEEKSSAKKKYLNHHNIMHKSKRDLKLALDFASRTVTIGGADGMKNKENMMKGVNKLLDSTERRFPKNLFMGEKGELMSEIVMMVSSSINSFIC